MIAASKLHPGAKSNDRQVSDRIFPRSKSTLPKLGEATGNSGMPKEGETRLCFLGPSGAVFETDFHHDQSDELLFTVLWFNANSTGYLEEGNGDQILSLAIR